MQDVKGDEDDRTNGAGDPVLQKQDLGGNPEPLTGLHRVTDSAVYPAGHQGLSLEDLQCRRPVGF